MIEQKPIETKIAIIGAGPSGLVASLWLIKKGIPHLLIDANNFPRDKSCGDIITSKVIRNLNELDPQIIPNMLQEELFVPIRGTKIYAPNTNSIEILFRGLDGKAEISSCYSVKRALFDEHLLNLIKRSDVATVMTNCLINKINFHNNVYSLESAYGKMINTLLIIGAWGSNSKLTKLLGGLTKEDKHFALGIRAYFTGIICEKDISELILDKSIFPGGFYITPLSKDTYNVNLVVQKNFIVKKKIDLKKQFEYLIKNNPVLNKKFINAKRVSEFKGSGLFLGSKKRKIYGPGYMLTGDAAGLIDLISGNGIPQAMISGKLAVEKALECLQANNFSSSFISNYEEKLYKKIKSDLSIGRLFNPILSFGLFRNIFFSIVSYLARKNAKNSSLVNFLYDSNPVYTLFNPSFYYKLFFTSNEAKPVSEIQ